MTTHHKKTQSQLKLCKVLAGREKWRERSNQYQAEKRKLSDRVRYLESRLLQKETQLTEAKASIDALKKRENSQQ
jgi:hypothetical protein